MKTPKALLLFAALFLLLSVKAFSQTVYFSQTGDKYHTKQCKSYNKNFEAAPLWKARDAYGKMPCPHCHPPTKDAPAPRKKAVKPKSKGTAPVKIKTAAPAKK